MAYDVYPLPPFLKLCEHVDITDTLYLNQTHPPLVNSLKGVLHIELYNKKLFTKLIATFAPPITYKHDTLQLSEDTSLIFPSVSVLHKETHICPPNLYLKRRITLYHLPFSPYIT